MEELDLHWREEDSSLGITSEGILCKDLADIENRIEKVKTTVKKINLDNQNALTEIPAVIGECVLLEELDISHTRIREIPLFIFSLPNLRSLSCCCSYLSRSPQGFSRAKKLEKLHLRINKDWVFPKEITAMENLMVLSVDLYSDAALPKDLGAIKNLEELSLAIKYDEGDIPALPGSFTKHPSLKKVSINDPFYRRRKTFDLESAAKILSSCSELTSLKLSGFAVGKEHQSLSLLTGLKELELRHLLVEGNIFNSITSLNKLEKLDVWGSEFKITKLPDIFTGFSELQSFSFAGNMVLELPPSIYTLSKLNSLEIGSTGISALDEKIANLKNLEIIHVYDCILDKLPDSIFTLPNLKFLNIEENIFNQNSIASIKEKLHALAQKGRKIEFVYDGQGHRQMVKRLRSIKNAEAMDITVYFKYCMNAVNENPFALKYVNKNKLKGSKFYAQLCMAAVREDCTALENTDPDMLGKPFYFLVCMEAAKSSNIAKAIKMIKGELLTDDEYIQVCIEAALHNRSTGFLENFNNEAFKSRFSREVYERLCWVAILHYPPVIAKMENPTKELFHIAAKRLQK